MQAVSSPQRPVSIRKGEKEVIVHSSILKALAKATKRSTHQRYQTGCVIVNKSGGILSTGCSHSSSRRLNELHSIHAEIHALGVGRHYGHNRYTSTANVTQFHTAYIQTVARKSGNFTFSAPCLTCAIALYNAGVKYVVFTNGDNHPMKSHWNEYEIDYLITRDLKIYPRRNS